LIDAHIPDADTIALTAVRTIILSVVANDLTAKPLIGELVARPKSTWGADVLPPWGHDRCSPKRPSLELFFITTTLNDRMAVPTATSQA
jgi:hypothetical protein